MCDTLELGPLPTILKHNDHSHKALQGLTQQDKDTVHIMEDDTTMETIWVSKQWDRLRKYHTRQIHNDTGYGAQLCNKGRSSQLG